MIIFKNKTYKRPELCNLIKESGIKFKNKDYKFKNKEYNLNKI